MTPKELFEFALTYHGDDCVLWPFVKTAKGYARIRIDGKHFVASRLICTIEHGEPPDPKYVASHTCPNRNCIARRHLRWLTNRDNVLEGRAAGKRIWSGRSWVHCSLS